METYMDAQKFYYLQMLLFDTNKTLNNYNLNKRNDYNNNDIMLKHFKEKMYDAIRRDF